MYISCNKQIFAFSYHLAGLLLYFWIVVLELFLKMGPFLMFEPPMPPGGMGPVPPGVSYPPLMYQANAQMYQAGPPQQQLYAHYGRERPL